MISVSSLLSQSQAQIILKKSKQDPIFHIVNVQGVKSLHGYQAKKVIDAVMQYNRVAVKSCHDTGKTWMAAKLALWFCSSFEGAKVITTAPTWNQVKRLLWSEINAGHQNSSIPLGGKMLETECKIEPDWFAVGFSTNKSGPGAGTRGQGSNSTFQGFHSKDLLIIFDEATGIHKNIWTQSEGMLTSAGVKFLAIGNPTTKASEFYKCFQDPAFKKVHLSCFDSPNLIASKITNILELQNEINRLRVMNDRERLEAIQKYPTPIPYLITTQWVVSMAFKWGITHPLFVSKVLGEFPEEDDHILMPLGLVEDAQRKQLDPNLQTPVGPIVIGIDVARYGGDATVFVKMIGDQVIEIKRI